MKPDENDNNSGSSSSSATNEKSSSSEDTTIIVGTTTSSASPPTFNASNQPQSTEAIVRSGVGEGMHAFSDLVNNNLVAFRYGTVATVALLTAYGLANTPLFFRYKSVAEIPAKMFTGRKRLRARLLETVENDQAGQPITLYVRHLSPAGSILNRELFDLGMKASPSNQIHSTHSNNPKQQGRKDWLKVEIAGLSAPPFYSSLGGYQRGEWLRQLAKEKTMVKLQLLGRRVTKDPKSAQPNKSPTKRDVTSILPEVESTLKKESGSKADEEQVAVCRLYYRPSFFRLFATDVADSLVRYGHASVESELFLHNPQTTAHTQIADASSRLDDIRKDVQYLERLGKLEYQAAKGSYGMWSDTSIRDKRRDVVEEVEFQANASIWQKLWRRIRG